MFECPRCGATTPKTCTCQKSREMADPVTTEAHVKRLLAMQACAVADVAANNKAGALDCAEEAQRDADTLQWALSRVTWRTMESAPTCETCKFAGASYATVSARRCALPLSLEGAEKVCIKEAVVPLTIHGKPFSCAGWTAKSDDTTKGGA